MEESLERSELEFFEEAAGKLNFMSGIISLYMKPKLSRRAVGQISRLRSGSDIAKFLQNELRTKYFTENQKLHFLASITTPVHENRHWHEYVGTTLGFELFWSSVEYYSRTIMVLRHLANKSIKIQLPLNRRTFYNMASNNHMIEFSNYNSLFNKLLKKKLYQVDDVSLDIRKVTENKFNVPYLRNIPFIWPKGREMECFFSDVPLTGISLLEASAVLSEVFTVYDTFGEEESQLYMRRRFELPNLWIYSSVIKALMLASKNVSVELMMAIISNSLVYPIGVNTKESNPAERFKEFLDRLSMTETAPTTFMEIEEWIRDVIDSNNWVTPNEIAEQHILFSQNKIREFKNIIAEENREPDSLESYVIYYFKNHITFFENYKSNFLFWATDYFYKELPSSPVLENFTNLNANIVVDGSETSLGWYSIVNAIEQFFKTDKSNFVCPFRSNCQIKTITCGKLPLSMPPDHPECNWLVAMCELLVPKWNL
jgi:hypothetical protein